MKDSFEDIGSDIEEKGFKLIEEMALDMPQNARSSEGVAGTRLRVQLIVIPANICDRRDPPIEAKTVDIRRRSVICISKQPIAVGSVFMLSLDQGELAAPPVLGMCKRCSMLTEEAFETQFVTYEDLKIPEPSKELEPSN